MVAATVCIFVPFFTLLAALEGMTSVLVTSEAAEDEG